jgi:hypothetical protein
LSAYNEEINDTCYLLASFNDFCQSHLCFDFRVRAWVNLFILLDRKAGFLSFGSLPPFCWIFLEN